MPAVEFAAYVYIDTPRLTFGECHHRLRTSRPSRGALMRRHEGGAGPAPAGVVRSCTPGRTPEQPRRLLPGRLGSGHRGTRKREKPVARWTGAFLLLASALARHTPSFWGNGKRDGLSRARTKSGTGIALAMRLDLSSSREIECGDEHKA